MTSGISVYLTRITIQQLHWGTFEHHFEWRRVWRAKRLGEKPNQCYQADFRHRMESRLDIGSSDSSLISSIWDVGYPIHIIETPSPTLTLNGSRFTLFTRYSWLRCQDFSYYFCLFVLHSVLKSLKAKCISKLKAWTISHIITIRFSGMWYNLFI